MALNGMPPPFTEATALGLDEPELLAVFGAADGLGAADDAELPEAVVAVTVPVPELVVSAVGAKAERT
jgi:hypothetical protein